MIQAFIAKKIIDVVIKKVMKKREVKKMRKYVEEDNELDIAVKDLTKRMDLLERDSHPQKNSFAALAAIKRKKLTTNNKRRK